MDEANQSSAAFARVFKEFILVTYPDKPLPCTAKGTVVRKQAYLLYEAEIDGIYVAALDDGGTVPPKSWEVDDLKAWLIVSTKELVGVDIKESVDLFEQGADRYGSVFLILYCPLMISLVVLQLDLYLLAQSYYYCDAPLGLDKGSGSSTMRRSKCCFFPP